MAENLYQEQRNGHEYVELRSGNRYAEARDAAPDPPGILPFRGVSTRLAYLLRVVFDEGAGDYELFSHGHPTPYISGELFHPSMTIPLSLTQTVADSSGILNSNVQRSFGSVSISLPGGLASTLAQREWKNKPFIFYVGPLTHSLDDFERIHGFVAQARFSDRDMTLTVTDGSHLFRTDVALHFYTGEGLQPDGTDEGHAELAGSAKPRCFGEVYNIEPVLVNPDLNIYQIHFRGIIDFRLGYVAGGTITTVGDITDAGINLTTVDDWVPVPGRFITDRGRGTVRLGNPPDGRFTIDAFGDYLAVERRPLDLMKVIHDIYGPTEIPFNQSDGLSNHGDAARAGIYLAPSEIPSLDALYTRISSSMGNYWYIGPTRRLHSRRLETGAQIELNVTGDNILLEPSPTMTRLQRPVRSVRVKHKKNYTVMTEDEILPVDTPSVNLFRQFATTEGESLSDFDPLIPDDLTDAREVIIDSIVIDEAGALYAATTSLAQGSFQLKVFEFSTVNSNLQCFIGKTVEAEIGSLHIRGVLFRVTEDFVTRRTRSAMIGFDI